MKKILIAILFSFSFSTHGDEVSKEFMKIGYFGEIFGHIHQNPSRYSTSLTNIACGHPVRIYSIKEGDQVRTSFGSGWKYVTTGPYEGYLQDQFIKSEKPTCFQDKYPRFFEQMGLSITEMHFWGRLYDHFLIDKTELP